MIFKILLCRSVQTPNSDKNWQTSCPLQTFVCNISWHLELKGSPGQLGLRVAGFACRWVTKCLVSVCLCSAHQWILQNGWTDRGAFWSTDSWGPKELCIGWEYKLAPPGEYDWTIRGRCPCCLVLNYLITCLVTNCFCRLWLVVSVCWHLLVWMTVDHLANMCDACILLSVSLVAL